MSDQPGQPGPPEEWRVYRSDPTPDPEPAPEPAPQPAPQPAQTFSTTTSTTTRISATPKLILIMIVVAVVAAGVAGAIAISGAVSGGLGGIDAKDPKDFQKLVAKLKEDKGTTQVQGVGFYTDYIIVYLPYTDDPGDDRQISYTWRGGGFEEWNRTTSDEPTFDLAEIDTDAIDGMCDPVLEEAQGATLDDCYVSLQSPTDGKSWYRAFASDDFGKSVLVEYDQDGVEVDRTCDGQPCP